jgi:hypothetical protein
LLISYNLRNNDDITTRIAAENASMGALQEVWCNSHLDVYNKYLLFRAIPMNLLLWGAETWLLRKSQLNKLEVFLHCSIWCILQISMTKLQEQWLRNDKVWEMFYSIPCVRKMIAAWQINFVRKMIRGPPNCPSCNMITACCNHKRQVGRPQMTGKNLMVENLRLLFHDVTTVQIDQYCSLRTWIHEASNKKYWCQLIDQLLHSLTPLPDQPADWGPLPSWQACRAAAGHPPAEDIPDSNNKTTTDKDDGQPRVLPQPPPWTLQHSPAAETPYKLKQWLANTTFCSMVVWSMPHLLKILGLGLSASEMEIKVLYQQLRTNTTWTRTTPPRPDSLLQKHQIFSSSSTMPMNI